MYRYWQTVIRPVLEAVTPSTIVEIGAFQGRHTEKLVEYASNNEAVLHAVDPAPDFDVEAMKARYGDVFTMHRERSLNALSRIPSPDVVLIDGDHNWYTVYHELQLLDKGARATGSGFPITLIHDVGWPYGRRDQYYSPEVIPEAFRLPFRREGLNPDSAEPVGDRGLNAHLDNAIYEHNLRNGVRTAVEDFISESDRELLFRVLPGHNGLGVLGPGAGQEETPFTRLLEWLDSKEFLAQHAEFVENLRVRESVARDEAGRDLRDAKTGANELREARTEAETKLSETAHELAAVRETLATFRRERDRLSASLEARLEELDDAHRELGATVNRAEAAALKAQDERDRLDAELSKLQVGSRELQSLLETEKQRAAAAEDSHAQLARATELERRQREELLRNLQSQLERTAASRSFRYGHRFFRLFAILTFRRPKRRTALDDALQTAAALRVETSEESEDPAIPPAGEAAAGGAFATQYAELWEAAGLAELTHEDLALPWPVFPSRPSAGKSPVASIVVCVHNALDDVRRCLQAVARHLTVEAEVIVVDDGSAEATAVFLDRVAATSDRVRLIRNSTPPHGYTIAANLGLRAAAGDYLVLLNSDTVVTAGWLERIIACGEEDPAIGIIGPVSNAATHQSVPHVHDDRGWATNPLPEWLTNDGMGAAVAALSPREYPRTPFVNGFCYVIRRRVLDTIGVLDEDLFASGYCEENDFSMRARDAGFEAAIADDAFVYHAKSRSYTPDGRSRLAGPNYATFLEKHGRDRVNALVGDLERRPLMRELRERLDDALTDPAAFVGELQERLGKPMRPIFVLSGIAKGGGSGGSHSIVQEASGMRELGVDARIAVPSAAMKQAAATYGEHVEAFLPFEENHLDDALAGATVAIATHFRSVPLVDAICRRQRLLGAYYVQDYEPFFVERGSPLAEVARATYTALHDGILFAKTHWLCNLVGAAHGVPVAKVVPSLDTALYHPPDDTERDAPLTVVAMIRPRTPRRQPAMTIHTLLRLRRAFGDQLDVVTFGCERTELAKLTNDAELLERHAGVLHRAEVAQLMRRADVFLDLSSYQAFGRTALEAMACGCIPVVPARGGAWEFARPGHNAVVTDTADPDRCYVDAVGLLRDEEGRSRMRAAGLEVAGRYSVERAALSELSLFAARTQLERPRPKLEPTKPGSRQRLNDAKDAVTVVIAVHNAREHVERCVDSVIEHTDVPYRLILIDDASTDTDVRHMLRGYAARRANVELVTHEVNQGYTATINHGVDLADGDIVLLNSDTIVTDGWLGKLRSVARSRPRVGTVTPLSNAAGAFSVPEINRDNELPPGMSIPATGRIIERLSSKVRPDVPTGNGFCMYVTKSCLEAVGRFDEQRFPRGYGEENDFCMRAAAAGFVHLIDDATFVYHRRGASFGLEKSTLIENSKRLLRDRYPDYKAQITEFLADARLDPLRREVATAFAAPQPVLLASRPRLLFVMHAGEGGIAHTSHDLLSALANQYDCYLLRCGLTDWQLSRMTARGMEQLELWNLATAWSATEPLDRPRRDLVRHVLEQHEIQLLHARSLLASGPELIEVAKEMGIRVVFSFHDFLTICPTIQLLDEKKVYCAGHCTPGYGECGVSKKWFRGGLPSLKHDYVYKWRESMARGLAACDAYVTTSHAAAAVIHDHFGFTRDGRLRVVEHGRDAGSVQRVAVPPTIDEPVRVVTFGALGWSKGIGLITDLMKMDQAEGRRFEFHFLGEAHKDFKPEVASGIAHGPYERDDLPGLLATIKPSFSLVPSIWPETYCHTLTEAWMVGLPAFASDIGTIRERIQATGGGWLLDYRDPARWYREMVEIAASPEEWRRRREEIERMPWRTVDEMALDYRKLYSQLLDTSSVNRSADGRDNGALTANQVPPIP